MKAGWSQPGHARPNGSARLRAAIERDRIAQIGRADGVLCPLRLQLHHQCGRRGQQWGRLSGTLHACAAGITADIAAAIQPEPIIRGSLGGPAPTLFRFHSQGPSNLSYPRVSSSI